MSEIVWVCERCDKPQAGNPITCWRCGYTVYRPTFPNRAQPVDNSLGLTEQQQSDSALNEMIETLPLPFKNMSGMYNGMTVRPTAQPMDSPVDIEPSTSEAPNASAET